MAAGTPGIAAVVTTELALLTAARPLWPQDIPFRQLESTVRELGLAVLAHADDFNLGQSLLECGAGPVPTHRNQRWDHPANRDLTQRIREFATAHELTPREVNLAWLLNRPFPVVALVGLPALLADQAEQYAYASHFKLTEADQSVLNPAG